MVEKKAVTLVAIPARAQRRCPAVTWLMIIVQGISTHQLIGEGAGPGMGGSGMLALVTPDSPLVGEVAPQRGSLGGVETGSGSGSAAMGLAEAMAIFIKDMATTPTLLANTAAVVLVAIGVTVGTGTTAGPLASAVAAATLHTTSDVSGSVAGSVM
jgi:hypothetical protein